MKSARYIPWRVSTLTTAEYPRCTQKATIPSNPRTVAGPLTQATLFSLPVHMQPWPAIRRREDKRRWVQ